MKVMIKSSRAGSVGGWYCFALLDDASKAYWYLSSRTYLSDRSHVECLGHYILQFHTAGDILNTQKLSSWSRSAGMLLDGRTDSPASSRLLHSILDQARDVLSHVSFFIRRLQMDDFVHAEMLFNLPWQASAYSFRDISLHYPDIRLFASTLKDNGSY